jgi:hypothetical protein
MYGRFFNYGVHIMSVVLVFLIEEDKLGGGNCILCEDGVAVGKCGKWESWFSVWGRKQKHARLEHEVGKNVKVKQSHYRPGVAHRVPRS